jgi:hypothetical protein
MGQCKRFSQRAGYRLHSPLLPCCLFEHCTSGVPKVVESFTEVLIDVLYTKRQIKLAQDNLPETSKEGQKARTENRKSL